MLGEIDRGFCLNEGLREDSYACAASVQTLLALMARGLLENAHSKECRHCQSPADHRSVTRLQLYAVLTREPLAMGLRLTSVLPGIPDCLGDVL